MSEQQVIEMYQERVSKLLGKLPNVTVRYYRRIFSPKTAHEYMRAVDWLIDAYAGELLKKKYGGEWWIDS